MAIEVRRYLVTVPANTPITAPAVTPITFPVRIVRSIDWHLPPGCSNQVGFFISMSGVQVVPLPAGTWTIGDGVKGQWNLHDAPDSGAWQCTAYNTGNHPHTIHLDFHLDLVIPRPVIRAPVMAAQLAEQPDLSQAGPPTMRPWS